MARLTIDDQVAQLDEVAARLRQYIAGRGLAKSSSSKTAAAEAILAATLRTRDRLVEKAATKALNRPMIDKIARDNARDARWLGGQGPTSDGVTPLVKAARRRSRGQS